ncbi:FERM domain-containing protein 8 [Merluccius polli]|uniref:FERM domain-containing protein 8 n=1 Tax=Merluccius polli TaxID=89951 RepID=A0AA47MP90_MERPO|nr:FERM domain-containing protein 8 [Merluccius polli]
MDYGGGGGDGDDDDDDDDDDDVTVSVPPAQDVLVYLAGDRVVHLTIEGVGGVSVQELGRDVRDALRIPDAMHDAFAFWLCSPLLELQLKPRHQPYKLCRQWQDLLYRFTEASEEDISQDEPCLQYRRNVFYPKSKELQMEDEGMLRLLYEEARSNILSDRYPCDPDHWTGLGAMSLALEEGVGLDQQTLAAVIKEKKLVSFLPTSVVYGGGGLFSTLRGRGGRQAGLEHKLLEEYHKVCSSSGPSDTPHLLHQYLKTCHALPYYGCAFFSGEIDKPVQGLLQRGKRKAVNVGISLDGVYVMDVKEKHVLLGLRFSELSWDHSYPEEEGDSHILWLEFDGDEAGTPVNKLLKIYSKQAELMSGLIEFCVELRSPSEGVAAATAAGAAAAAAGEDEVDGGGGGGGGASGDVTQGAENNEGHGKGRGGRRGKLSRQDSVVCSRVQALSTISYVNNGMEIKRLKPKRAASFFARNSAAPTYATVQAADGLEQG